MESTQYKQNRERLKALSNAVKPMVKAGTFDTINDAIIETEYKDNQNQVFNTFWEWKKEGKSVIKGEKAFPIWGKPRKAADTDPKSERDEYSFFPLAYLFSNAQVK